MTQGHLARDFSLPDSNDRFHSLEEFKGNAIFVHFWASWCPPCLDEIPALRTFARKFEGRKFRVIAISVDSKREDAQRILPTASLPSDFISLLDVKGDMPEAYGTYQFPETYLISPDLKVITKWVGPQNWDQPDLLKAIDQIIPKR